MAAVVLAALGIVLGNWQTRRAEEKLALQARLQERAAQAPLRLDGAIADPAAVEFRRVAAAGAYVPDWTVFLDNRPLDGRSGLVVVMAFTIAGTNRVVLVERGWVARGAGAHDSVPAVAVPSGPRTVEGVAVLRPARVMELGPSAPLHPGAIVQNVDPAAFARASGLDVLPVLVEQTNADGDAGAALVRAWPAPALGVDRHRGYAFQWYALAVMALLFFVITGFRRASRPAS